MNFFGRKKAVSVREEKRNDLLPSAYNKYCENYDKNADNEDDCSNTTGDYGVILIKTYQNLKSSSVWDKVKKSNTTNHRGQHSSEQNKPKDAPEGLVERLSFAICGICASDKYVWHEYPSAASTDVSEDSFDKAGPNAILLRQNQFLQEENQRQLETSLLTDVSFLTDGSPMDLELNDIENDLSSSFDLGVKALPAFRKTPPPRKAQYEDPAPKDLLAQTRNNPMWIRKMNAVEEITGISSSRLKPPPAPRKPRLSSIRRSQRDQPMPEDLLQHTRKNPIWKSQMSNAMKKSSHKKRKSSSSSRRKKKFPLERPEVRRMV